MAIILRTYYSLIGDAAFAAIQIAHAVAEGGDAEGGYAVAEVPDEAATNLINEAWEKGYNKGKGERNNQEFGRGWQKGKNDTYTRAYNDGKGKGRELGKGKKW